MKSVKTTFKYKNEIIYNICGDLTIEGVDTLKFILSQHLHINKENIDVEVDIKDLSDFDIGQYGMHHIDTIYDKIKGVRLNLIEGSDEHLEAISNGTLENYLEFY